MKRARTPAMDEISIVQYITDTFDAVHVHNANGTYFFFYGEDRMLPFATLVTSDAHDQASDLNRPSVFRLNVGVGKDTFLSLFGSRPSPPGESGVVNTGHDFTALNQLMPHPIYGHLNWVCVLNPSDATFQTVGGLLAEAHSLAVARQARRAGQG
jgi:hypothetical protein